jgi:hypothetical protein
MMSFSPISRHSPGLIAKRLLAVRIHSRAAPSDSLVICQASAGAGSIVSWLCSSILPIARLSVIASSSLLRPSAQGMLLGWYSGSIGTLSTSRGGDSSLVSKTNSSVGERLRGAGLPAVAVRQLQRLGGCRERAAAKAQRGVAVGRVGRGIGQRAQQDRAAGGVADR